MKVKIIQKQDKKLLEEHVKSSLNFSFIARNELYLAIIFFLIGIITSLLLFTNPLMGLPLVSIGLIEIIKFPSREKRWVKKKEKEKLFNKIIVFEILDDILKITYNDKTKTHNFSEIRECLISKTGILFKVSYLEYYYISFKSLDKEIKVIDLVKHLKKKFKKGKIKIR